MSSELKRALYNISALVDLGQEITGGRNFQKRIQSVLHVITGTFLTNKGAILAFNKPDGQMHILAQRGFDQLDPERASSEGLKSLARNEPCPIPADLGFGGGTGILAPLWVRDEFAGIVLLGEKFTTDPYTVKDFELLRIIAAQIAVALNNHSLFNDLSGQLDENRRLYEEMRHIYHDTIQAFAAAIDAKDAYTKHHSQRVAKYSVAIARELGWNDHDIEGIYVAGYLHDVGKLVISNELLNKKKPFTPKELKEIRTHSTLSHRIISKINFPWKDVGKMIKHHHERLDGSGYPDALTNEELNDGVRILTLADAFDAMTSRRAYRDKMDIQDALNELKNCLDTQFDNRIMLAFCRVLDKEIKGELPEPDILPHFDRDSDLSVITTLLEGIIRELSA
ncbi:MAG: HD domain-containing phosphohydrolase [Thermodesulfovibrionales bacterium]